jgi:hypothetical protein
LWLRKGHGSFDFDWKTSCRLSIGEGHYLLHVAERGRSLSHAEWTARQKSDQGKRDRGNHRSHLVASIPFRKRSCIGSGVSGCIIGQLLLPEETMSEWIRLVVAVIFSCSRECPV